MKRKKIFIACLITLLIAITFFLVWRYIFSNDSKKETDVFLTAPQTMASISTIVALEKGFFKDEGLKVKVNYVGSGKVAMDDLIGGNANYATVTETNIAFAGFNNPQIKILCNIQLLNDATIVARKDKGITKPTDLKGKRLGLILATSSQTYANKFLEKYGLRGKVEIINLLPLATQSAIIEGGAVDAISVFQPLAYNAEKALGNDAILFKERELFTGYMNLAGNSGFIMQNPDINEKMIKAYIKSEEFIANNKLESIEIVSKIVKLDKEVVERIWGQYEVKISMNKELLRIMDNRGKWIISTQKEFGSRPLPDYSTFFDDSFLKKLDENRVK